MSRQDITPSLGPLMPRSEYVTQIEENDIEPRSVRHRRSSVACTECRARRRKCSGHAPCEECALHSRVCTIDPLHDKRKKMDLKALEQELQYYRTFLHQLCQVIYMCDYTDVEQLVDLIRQGGTNKDIKNAVEGYLLRISEFRVSGVSSGKHE
ncbi:hypothetical protein ETB97_005218 [Aspergillus alliaceus]|uniref:Zn(2)-C6 fungal-type domain-containing protein n=1 Tax=Petromyces alliaceus TaxID=209559 RepID=A0A8H5ZYY8_PETAA|nr:hypothetical protein ETB97_005218 [Aspergillus burnettii]